jgi:hypothetical protein
MTLGAERGDVRRVRLLKDSLISSRRRRLLLLSFHFPPAETAGSLRWQKLAEYLAENGWSLDVITNDVGVVPRSGQCALDDLPKSTRVFAVPEGQAFARKYSRSLSRTLKGLRLPSSNSSSAPHGATAGDAARAGSLHHTEIGWRPFSESVRRAYGAVFRLNLERGWARAAEHCASYLLTESDPEYRAIVSCGPPHLAHFAGMKLHRRTGIPFIIDMRDPWGFVERLPEAIASPVWMKLSRFLEERCILEAALVIANTEPAAEQLRNRYPGLGPFVSIRNGSDIIRSPARPADGPFKVAFAGSIYLDRDPRPLFVAASRLVSEHELDPAEFRLVLVGNVSEFSGVSVRTLAESAGIGDHVDLLYPVPRDELEGILGSASVLVSLPQDSDLAIPSKIYEYAEYPSWLLAISEADSATGRLLANTAADLVPPGSAEAIFDALDARYRQYLMGLRPRALAEDVRFQRSIQAERLVELLGKFAETR